MFGRRRISAPVVSLTREHLADKGAFEKSVNKCSPSILGINIKYSGYDDDIDDDIEYAGWTRMRMEDHISETDPCCCLTHSSRIAARREGTFSTEANPWD